MESPDATTKADRRGGSHLAPDFSQHYWAVLGRILVCIIDLSVSVADEDYYRYRHMRGVKEHLSELSRK